MMKLYTLKHYTNVMNRHQREESRRTTCTVVMHRRDSLTFPIRMSYPRVARKDVSIVSYSSSVVS